MSDFMAVTFQEGPFDGEWRRIEQDTLNQEAPLTFYVPPKDPLSNGVKATYQYDHSDTLVPPFETIAQPVDVYTYVGSEEDFGTLEDFHH